METRLWASILSCNGTIKAHTSLILDRVGLPSRLTSYVWPPATAFMKSQSRPKEVNAFWELHSTGIFNMPEAVDAA